MYEKDLDIEILKQYKRHAFTLEIKKNLFSFIQDHQTWFSIGEIKQAEEEWIQVCEKKVPIGAEQTSPYLTIKTLIMGSTGENVAPSFVKKPALRQEDDGNRLVFECKLAGNPKPEVTWFREDIKIQNDERATFKVQEEGRNTFAVILELNDVVETDAGLYKVKAKNKYGEVSASINLNFSRK